MSKVAVYLRVSSAKQADDDRFGLKVQERMVQDYAKAHELNIVETYTDTITGKASTRDGLTALL